MIWLVFSICFCLIQTSVEAATRDTVDDDNGIISIVILAVAALVLLLSAIVFAYILYKLWNGNFGRRRSISKQRIIVHRVDNTDGNRYSTMSTQRASSSFTNQVVVDEVGHQETETGVIETAVTEDATTNEEVLITRTPATGQAEMETQELVVVFNDTDSVVDVFVSSSEY